MNVIIIQTHHLPQILIDGHTDSTEYCAVHPSDPSVFATVDAAGFAYVWDATMRSLRCKANLGMACRSVAFSQQPVPASAKIPNWQPQQVRDAGVGGCGG